MPSRRAAGEDGVDLLDHRLLLRAAGDVGLVGHDDERKTLGAQAAQRVFDAGEDFHLIDPGRGVGRAAADRRAIEHAVAVEEHCRA
jgi:hypothetical protein